MEQLPDPSADTFVGYLTLSADGQTAVIEGRDKLGTDTDLFYACQKDGAWGDAQPLTQLNTAFGEGTPYLTADGQWLWFASDRAAQTPGDSDLYRVHTKQLPIPCP